MGMRRVEFAPCLPTRGTAVPAGAGWIHESKHDGYRLTVHREGKRVRLFTRNGHDWTDRYPLIVEAALRIRVSSFVLDGEAVLLGIDGRSDFDGLHSRQHNDEVQFYAFDVLMSESDDLRVKQSWLGCSHAASTGFFFQNSRKARSARTCFGMPAY